MYALKTCTFIGNHDCLQSVYPTLKHVVTDLILHKDVRVFYVGTQGNYDRIVQHVLTEACKEFEHIKCYVVLAYVPQRKQENRSDHSLPTLLPEGIEKIFPRFAITWRNQWMIQIE